MSVTGSPQSVPGRPGDPPVSCTVCGRVAADDTWRLTWATGTEGGREQRCCDRCSRDHLRSIEARLDPAWW